MNKSVLIVGAGYVGRALGDRLRSEGWVVTGWVRSEKSAEELKTAGWNVIAGDAAHESSWKDVAPAHLVFCPSTRGGEVADYRHIHIEGLRNALAHTPAGFRVVYVSATSVYGQDDGSIVTEDSPTEPKAETSRVLLEAEALAIAAGGTALRVSAIYGPGRGVLYRRLLHNEAFIPDGPPRWINMVHRDDVAGAIHHVLRSPDSAGQVYNVTDNEPVTYAAFYDWLCERLQLPRPPVRDIAGQMKKRGFTRKQVSNAKLLASGWTMLYPDFRAGYSAIIESEKS